MDRDVKIEELVFNEEIEADAIKLAALSIIKSMFSEGLISEYELQYIREKYPISVE